MNLSIAPGILLDLDRILQAQVACAPLLSSIDAANSEFTHEQQHQMLYRYIEDRMYRYAGRLAKEHKIQGEGEIRTMFYRVVDDIFAHARDLMRKDGNITPDEVSVLHTRLYPKGLWGATIQKDGSRIFVNYPTGVYRDQEDYVKTPTGDFWFLESQYIPQTMKGLDGFFSVHTEIHPLIRIILILGLTWYIHPFYNGNGTVYRFYVAIELLRNGYGIPSNIESLLSDNDYLMIQRNKILAGDGYDLFFGRFLELFVIR